MNTTRTLLALPEFVSRNGLLVAAFGRCDHCTRRDYSGTIQACDRVRDTPDAIVAFALDVRRRADAWRMAHDANGNPR